MPKLDRLWPETVGDKLAAVLAAEDVVTDAADDKGPASSTGRLSRGRVESPPGGSGLRPSR